MAAMAEVAPAAEASSKAGIALIKSLAACNASTRSRTLKSLISWLQLQHNHQPQPPLSDDDLKKLWKGLFYCVWQSDKAINQSNLIDRLSSLVLSLSPPLSLLYFSHFLLTLRREWPGIDRIRLDKFCLMIRVFVRKLFELLRERRWNLDVVEEYWGVLEERLFVCEDDENRLGDGVTYHVISVFCDEIKPFLPLRLDVLNVLFRPFVSVLGRTDNKVLLGKLKSDLFDYLVRSGRGLLQIKKSGEEADSRDERVLFGTIVLGMEFSLRFYELGSSPDCVQGNRKFLFSLHEEFSKLEKEVKSSGVDVKLPETNGDEVEDDEMPQFIPINNDDLGGEDGELLDKLTEMKKNDKGAPEDKQSKKRKKKKSPENVDVPVETTNDNEKVSDVEGDNLVDESDLPKINDAMLSELQMQFEVVAAEAELVQGVSRHSSSLDSPTFQGNTDISKKRKRTMKDNGKISVDSDIVCEQDVEEDNNAKKANGKISVDSDVEQDVEEDNNAKKANGKISVDSDVVCEQDVEEDNNARTAEKSGKKVKFSMRDNLVWNPRNPLPPQSVRIPPSATPRGSALKKGVPPGPVWEMPSGTKMAKKKKNKNKKVVRRKSPAIKRIKKLKSLSA